MSKQSRRGVVAQLQVMGLTSLRAEAPAFICPHRCSDCEVACVAPAEFQELVDRCESLCLFACYNDAASGDIEDGGCAMQSKLNVLFVSAGVKELKGYTPTEFMALMSSGNLYDHIHPDDKQRVMQTIGSASGLDWMELPHRQLYADGSYVECHCSMTVRNQHVYGIFRRSDAELTANAALRDLLISTSYDLRCAATNVISSAALLRERPGIARDSEATFLADTITNSCSLLNGLACNVLCLADLERNEILVRPQRFCIKDRITSVITMCAMAKTSGATLAWVNDSNPELPDSVLVDGVLLCHCVQNLVTNALKFSNGKRVELSVYIDAPSAEAADPSARILRVEVADHGVGIGNDMQEAVFAKYMHAPADKGGGTGLGLHMSRGMARAMGGDITLQSSLGVGSTFTIRVPISLTLEAAADERVDAGGAGGCGPPPSNIPDSCGPDCSGYDSCSGGNVPACTRFSVDPFSAMSYDELVNSAARE